MCFTYILFFHTITSIPRIVRFIAGGLGFVAGKN